MIGEFFPISGFEDKVDLFQCTGGEGEEEEVLNTVAKAGSAGELKRVSVGWIAPEGFQASEREEAACFLATVSSLSNKSVRYNLPTYYGAHAQWYVGNIVRSKIGLY